MWRSIVVFLAIVSVSASGAAAICAWTSPSGIYYDFTRLGRVGGSYKGAEGGAFEYAFNFCTSAITSQCGDDKSIGLEIFGTNCRSIAASSVNPSFSYKNGADSSAGILMKYTGISSVLVYELVCSSSTYPSEPFAVSFNAGTYTVGSLGTSFACDGGSTPTRARFTPRPSQQATRSRSNAKSRSKTKTKQRSASRSVGKVTRTNPKTQPRSRTSSKTRRYDSSRSASRTNDAKPSNTFAPLPQCTWRSPKGEHYDFRGLAKVGSSYEGREGFAYTYALNFCTSAISAACPTPGSIGYEISGPYCLSLASTTVNPTYSYANGVDNSSGILMTYGGRTPLTYLIECSTNPRPQEPFTVSYSNGAYTAKGIRSVFGCPVAKQSIQIAE